MRVRATLATDRNELQSFGSQDGDISEGLVFVAARDLADWQAVEDELTEAFELVQLATTEGAPVVFVVDTDAMLGRADALDSMAATALVSAARVLAFEGLRKERYVGIISTDRTGAAGRLSETISFTVSTRAALGQVIPLGIGHAGGMFP